MPPTRITLALSRTDATPVTVIASDWETATLDLAAQLSRIEAQIENATCRAYIAARTTPIPPSAPRADWTRSAAIWRDLERWAIRHGLAVPSRARGLGMLRAICGQSPSVNQGYPLRIREGT